MSALKSSQSTGGYQQQQTGVRSRTPDVLCPYSFVPISDSLTPRLSERTRAALAATGFRASEKRFQHREKPFTGTKFDGGRAFQERRANTFHCAVRVLSPTYSGLAEISVAETEAHRVQRADQGLIVGDMAADPRFATRDMWHNGEATETDRARMFWRMAWVAQHGEDRLVGLSAITVADLRSMEDLQQMWQPVDALMPVLSSSKGNPVSSVAARSSQAPSAGATPRARVKEQIDAYEVEYQPASQPFAAGTAVASAILGIAVTLALGYFAFGDKLLASPPAPHASDIDAGGSGDTDSPPQNNVGTGNPTDTGNVEGAAPDGSPTGSSTSEKDPISLYISAKSDVTAIAESLKAPDKPTPKGDRETPEAKQAREALENASESFKTAKTSIKLSGFIVEDMNKIIIAVLRTGTPIRLAQDSKLYFDPLTKRVSKIEVGDSPSDWKETGVYIFDAAEEVCASPDLKWFEASGDRPKFCAYGPKSLLDQLKIPDSP